MNRLTRFYCFIFICIALDLHGQGVQIESIVNVDSIQIGQTISVNYSYPSAIPSLLKIQPSADFKLIDTSYSLNEASGMKICKANFITKRVGKLTLPSASLVKDGHAYSSNILKILVQPKNNQAPAKQDQSADNFFDDVPSGPATKVAKQQSDTVEYNGSQLFAQLEMDKTSPFLGEQITLQGFLYSLRPLDIKGMKAPKLDGFWVWEDSNANQMLNYEVVTIKGSKYFKYALFSNVLFPLRAGDIRIPSIPISCFADLELEGGDNNSDASLAKMFKLKSLVKRQVRLNSNSVLIHVKNLPVDATMGTVDLVGQYALRGNHAEILDFGKGTYEVTYTIEGKGNLKFVQAPVMPMNDDWDISEPVVVDSFSLKNGELSGVRKISYTLSSTKEGVNFIPAFALNYFNPASSQYATLKVDRTELKNIQQAENSNQLEVFNGIHEVANLEQHESTHLFSKANYWLAYLLPFALLLGSFGYKKYQLKRDVKRKYYEAKTNALKSIEVSQTLLATQKTDEYYNQIYNTLWTYIKDKFMIHQTNMNEEFVLKLFTDQQVNSSDRNRFVELNHACQARLYGSNWSNAVSNELSLQLKELIINLDNHCDVIQKK